MQYVIHGFLQVAAELQLYFMAFVDSIFLLHIQLKLIKFGMVFAASATLSIFWNCPSYDSGSEKNKDCRLAAPEMDGCYLGEHNCQLPDNMQILR